MNAVSIQRGISSRFKARELTGTIAAPVPAAPSTFTNTLYAPEFISQSCEEKRLVSPLTAVATSPETPSMVRMVLPSASPAITEQERAASPSM